MSLCDIHFHENAGHRGNELTTFAGNGDGYGYDTGFKYNVELSAAELADVGHEIGAHAHGVRNLVMNPALLSNIDS